MKIRATDFRFRLSRMRFPCYIRNGEHTFDIFAFPGSRTYARNNPNSRARLANICISGSLTHTRAPASRIREWITCVKKRKKKCCCIMVRPSTKPFYYLIPSPNVKLASGKIFRVLSHLLRDTRVLSMGPVTFRAHARRDRLQSAKKRSSAIGSLLTRHLSRDFTS